MRRLMLVVMVVCMMASVGAPAAARRAGSGRAEPFWSPDGRWLLVISYLEYANGLLAFDATDWSAPPRQLVSFDPDNSVMVPTARTIYDVAFTADGTRMVTAEIANGVVLWDTATFVEIGSFDASGGAVAFNADGTLLAAEHTAGVVRVFDVASGSVIHELINAHLWAMAFGVTDAGDVLATGGCLTLANGGCQQGAAWVWDAESGNLLDIIYGSVGWATDVAFTAASDELAVSGAFGLVQTWEPVTGEVINLHGDIVAPNVMLPTADGVAYSPDGAWLVAGFGDGEIVIWDRVENSVRMTLRQPDWVAGITFGPTGTRFATGSIGSGVRVWDVVTGEVVAHLLQPDA